MFVATNERISYSGVINYTRSYRALIEITLKIPPVDERNNLPYFLIEDLSEKIFLNKQ